MARNAAGAVNSRYSDTVNVTAAARSQSTSVVVSAGTTHISSLGADTIRAGSGLPRWSCPGLRRFTPEY